MDGERILAGLHCGEVTADLTAYLNAALSAERVRQVEEHLRDCAACARFAGELRQTAAALAASLGAAPVDEEVEERLLARLAAELK